MIFILEGPNGAGKTTLAKYLVANHGFTYHKDLAKEIAQLPNEYRAVATKEAIFAQARLFVSLAQNCDIVVDRFHLTEKVYGENERGYSVRYIPQVEELLSSNGNLICLVFVTDSTVNLFKRVGKSILGLVASYFDAYESSRMSKVRVCLDDGAERVISELGLHYKGVPFVFGTEKEVMK